MLEGSDILEFCLGFSENLSGLSGKAEGGRVRCGGRLSFTILLVLAFGILGCRLEDFGFWL